MQVYLEGTELTKELDRLNQGGDYWDLMEEQTPKDLSLVSHIVFQPKMIYRYVRLAENHRFAAEVLKYLLTHMDENNMAVLSYKDIRDMYDCSTKSISRAIHTLTDADIIKVYRQGNKCICAIDRYMCLATDKINADKFFVKGQNIISKDDIYEEL